MFELYKKMLRGESSPEETERVLQWLRDNPAAFEAAMLKEAGQTGQQSMPAAVRQQMLDYFASKGIAAPQETPVVTMELAVPGRRKWYQWSAAAAILLFAVAAWFVYPSLKTKAPSLTWLKVQNKGTTIQLFTLPDSSKVWLNTLATLRYRDDFNSHTERIVQLSGEGYFKVTHDTAHPFIVTTDHLSTRVLGTEFNVEAYGDEPFIKVTLQKGKVQVNSLAGNNSVPVQEVLAPGQMAFYSKISSRLLVKSSGITNPDIWTSDGLILNDVPLQDALQRIARKYNRSIVFDSLQAFKHQHITAYYQQMNIEQVLAQLGFTCQFSAKKSGDGYRIVWK